MIKRRVLAKILPFQLELLFQGNQPAQIDEGTLALYENQKNAIHET